ncbi:MULTISPECIES: DUF4362 domain-containing protein [Pontibacillus]|uniref:DUF4362 domain-containing protein n=1 Tax=Pontibacillus chungwhensis TaxID=265426 RepID=A0ABY8V4I1_9BACI|nr:MULTISPECIES: DUF4362 domain-containing protein [Pontibacillus]MCD5322212.1 DUF4362 domain-containing protein [Pontibacillus sp. HN14]WIF99505.1 DUF4362 domain-containing protein [Pontibacillus chungwhensis]
MMRNILVVTSIILFILSGCQSNGFEGTQDTTNSDAPEYVQSPEDIVDSHRDMTNVETFYAFIEHVNEGGEDEIRVVRYTTEGDPILHDLKYDGDVIHSTIDSRRDAYGAGSVSEATCKSIDVDESKERTDYDLTGCDGESAQRSILVVWK